MSVPASSLKSRSLPLAAAPTQRGLLSSGPSFEERLARSGRSLRAARPTTLQLNLGKMCNQTCRHCHVDAGPDRREVMSDAVLDAALALLETERMPVLDLTGGAPELHPRFREIVQRARAVGTHVLDRCNLTILRVPKYRTLGAFLAEHQVEVVASLPWYSASRTDSQRGDGVFQASLESMRELNALGYGIPSSGTPSSDVPNSGLILTLVTNPVGTYLSPPQDALERDWHRELWRLHGVRFTRLFTIQNMPISRFLEFLEEKGQTGEYLARLAAAYNPDAVSGLMCRNTLSVSYDGRLYDCDFNQMLELPILDARGEAKRIEHLELDALLGRAIRTASHCFGCTAGGGSSCGGALS